jgi:hypothetical protein
MEVYRQRGDKAALAATQNVSRRPGWASQAARFVVTLKSAQRPPRQHLISSLKI